jgi:hypothetical protein
MKVPIFMIKKGRNCAKSNQGEKNGLKHKPASRYPKYQSAGNEN